MKKKAAVTARDSLRKWLYNSKNIELVNLQRGKYFRLVATVVADGININQKLVKNKLARVYYGKSKRKGWCH